jgi:hypothetical protein
LIEHPGDIVVFDPDQPITDRRTEIARGSKNAHSDNAMPSATWSPNNSIDLGALPARCLCRLRPMPVQRSHHADPGEHRWPVMFCNQQQRLHRSLPFFGVVFCIGQFGDVERCVAERGEPFPARQYDWIEKLLIPRHDSPRGEDGQASHLPLDESDYRPMTHERRLDRPPSTIARAKRHSGDQIAY